MSCSKDIYIVVLLLICLGLSVSDGFPESHRPSEANVKAAYIYNFAKLIDWPETAFETADSPICLSILGKDPVVKALRTIEGKTIRNRPIIIRTPGSAKDVGKCHILYIGQSEQSRFNMYLPLPPDLSCLTVSSIDRFSRLGGMINFITVNNRIRFEINLYETRKAGLTISSRLLKVATVVDAPSEKEEP